MEGIGTGEFGVYRRDGEEGVDENDGEGGGGGVDGEGEPCNASATIAPLLTKIFC